MNYKLNWEKVLKERAQDTYDKLWKIFWKIGQSVEQRLPIIMEDKVTLDRFLESHDVTLTELNELYDIIWPDEAQEITASTSWIIGALVTHAGVNPLLDQRLWLVVEFHKKIALSFDIN